MWLMRASGIVAADGSLMPRPPLDGVVHSFANRQVDAPARIRSALQWHDLTTAEREAHTLKGVAGNIGAGEVEGCEVVERQPGEHGFT